MIIIFHYRYGTGFGIVGPIFGESSPLNIPNSIYGILFYLLTIVLGEHLFLFSLLFINYDKKLEQFCFFSM